jgi:hypothetical protein
MDTHKAYGIATTPSNLVGWYRKFGFEVFAQLKGPFDDLKVVVRKPVEVGAFQVPAPDRAATGRLGILSDAASQAKDYALGLAYEFLMPALAEVMGTRPKRFAKHESQMEEEETDPLLKLLGLGKGLPGKRVYDQYAERAWDQLAQRTAHDLVVFTAFRKTAASGPAETHTEQPGLAGDCTEQPEPTNGQVGQSGSTNRHTEQPEPAETRKERPEAPGSRTKQPKPTNGHVDQPGPTGDHSEQPKPRNGHVGQSRPEEEHTEQPESVEAHIEQPESVQPPEEKYKATPRPDKKQKPKRNG